MKLRAPIIILPDSPTDPKLFMVADLGYLTVKTEPVLPEIKNKFFEKQGFQISFLFFSLFVFFFFFFFLFFFY